MSTAQPILEIEALHHRFGQHVVLTDLDLKAAAGEKIAIQGPNGSGKTTLLRCIAGTIIATAGHIRVAGHEAGSLDARRITGVSLSQERPSTHGSAAGRTSCFSRALTALESSSSRASK